LHFDPLHLATYYSQINKQQQMLYPQQLSHGNVLTFTPPGFNQTLNVKFPDCRLAVCEKCKKNYKTRDMCRVRNSHTAEPWTTAYICFTLDDNCTDDDGKYIDKPLTVRMIQWQPFCVKKPFEAKTPVCSACKKTNRTRSFCRERHKHRQLPWCTVYVLLSPADTIDPATRVAPESIPNGEPGSEDAPKTDAAKAEESEIKPEATEEVAAAPPAQENKPPKKAGEDTGEDINDIAESRTFLAKVSCHHSSIHWLELAEFDASDSAGAHGIVAPDGHMAMARGGMPMQPMDPSQYYAHTMGGYAAQQHQFNLKSHQQYFFQMQQRQHQHYAAQQAAWQAQYNQQSTMQLQQATGQPPAAAGAPAPVTAGEAAAQQSKQNQQSEQTAGAAAAAAAQQQQGHQWSTYHQQMYQNQMAQFQQAGGVIPQGPAADTTEQPVDYSEQAHTDADDIEPAPVHGGEEDDEENDAKRARYV
jgi:hypothetical protein